MLDSLPAISNNIGAIITLNLSRNRLSFSCGLQCLLALQAIDVTHHRIYESNELNRLAVLPHFTQVWSAEGNPFPFARTEDSWRIAVSNSFAAERITGIKLNGSGFGSTRSRSIHPASTYNPAPTSANAESSCARACCNIEKQ